MGPRAGLERFWRIESPFTPPGIEPRTVQPIVRGYIKKRHYGQRTSGPRTEHGALRIQSGGVRH
jgi:hypothetical protein